MQSSDYSHEIDLGRKEPDYSSLSPVTPEKPKKMRTYYPTLYIEGVPGLEALPKEGCMMVKFSRKRLSLEEDREGEEKTGATLEIRSICLPEGDGETLEDAFSKMAHDDDEEEAEDEEDDE